MGPLKPGANVIVSGSGVRLAVFITSRSEPEPLSFGDVTTRPARGADCESVALAFRSALMLFRALVLCDECGMRAKRINNAARRTSERIRQYLFTMRIA